MIDNDYKHDDYKHHKSNIKSNNRIMVKLHTIFLIFYKNTTYNFIITIFTILYYNQITVLHIVQQNYFSTNMEQLIELVIENLWRYGKNNLDLDKTVCVIDDFGARYE